MKLLALLGLMPLLLVPACGDSGGASTGTGASTDDTSSGSTGASATGPTTSSSETTDTTDTTGDSGGETTGVDTTTTSTSDESDTAVATDTASTTTTATGTTDDDTTDTASGSSDSTTGDPVGGPLAISLKDVTVYANCMPIVDPDNIIGWWTVTYDNSQGAEESSAELTKATIVLSPNDFPSVHDIAVIPTQSGPIAPGQMVVQEQMKQKGAPTPGCGYCDQPYRLELTFSSGGVDVPVVHEDTLPCVY